MISKQQKWLFIHPPKTAGTSIAEALLPHSDDRKILVPGQSGSDNFELIGRLTYNKHQTLRSYQAMAQESLAEFVLIGGLRHPLERMLSLYFYPGNWVRERVPGGKRLSKTRLHFANRVLVRMEEPYWDEDRFIRLLAETSTLTDFYRLADGSVRTPDIAVETRSIPLAAAAIRDALGLAEFDILHLNKSLRPDKIESLSQSRELAHTVAVAHEEDYKNFGYDLQHTK